MNDRVYIHEFIDIIGHNRAHYMQHMTANWGPIGQEERDASVCMLGAHERDFPKGGQLHRIGDS